jgi:hypothetical protein
MEHKPLLIKATNLELVAKGGGEVYGETKLSDAEALALAQLLKRITWTDMRGCAVDDAEASLMRGAVEKIQDALAGAHYAPR